MATRKKAPEPEPEVVEEVVEEVPTGAQVPESVLQVLTIEDDVEAAIADETVPDLLRQALHNVQGGLKHLRSAIWQHKALWREDVDG